MNIIFLDLDGPMIPWWGPKVPDDSGKNGRLLDGFPFLSKFHPDAINNLSLIIQATDALVVTNSTHNGGYGGTSGAIHIHRMFKANGIDKALMPDSPTADWPKYMSGFKNKTHPDWKTRKDRALGIRAWFVRNGISMAATPFVAIDDSVEDFDIYNRKYPNYPKIPYIETGTNTSTSDGGLIIPDPIGVITLDNANAAINILRSHSHYTGKI